MIATLRITGLQRLATQATALTRRTAVALVLVLCCRLTNAQSASNFHETFVVTSAEPVTLDLDLSHGDLQVLYNRDGQVSITAFAQTSNGMKLGDSFFKAALVIEQNGNHFKLRQISDHAGREEPIHVFYRVDVPYRTEVTSSVGEGRQSFSGIMGPVKAVAIKGDIKASYLSKGIQAETDSGNIDLEVIGEHVEARTGSGNISGVRLSQGIRAETADGDISLIFVGPSTAIIKKGTGRIDVTGTRGSFTGSTDAGGLHLKAVPNGDWRLTSAAGNIQVEFPPLSKFDLDVSTDSGLLEIARDDIAKPDAGSRQFHQKVNGDVDRATASIAVYTGSGKIVIR